MPRRSGQRGQRIDPRVLLVPKRLEPVLEGLPVLRVACVVAVAEFGRNGHALRAHDDAAQVAAEKLPERRHTIRIDDRDVEQQVELVAQHTQGQRQRAGLGLEQVAIRRALRPVLGGRETRAFREVHHAGGHQRELLAGPASRFDVVEPFLGMLLQIGIGMAAHEGEVERPPRESDDRHVDQLLLQEELEHRDPAVQQVLEHEDVDPRLVIAVDHVPAAVREIVQPRDIPLRALREPHPRAVAGDPPRGDPVQDPVDRGAHGLCRYDQLDEREQEEEPAPEQRVERQQRCRDDATREWWKEGEHGVARVPRTTLSRTGKPARKLDGVEDVLEPQPGFRVAFDQQTAVEEQRVGVGPPGRQQQEIGGTRGDRDVDGAVGAQRLEALRSYAKGDAGAGVAHDNAERLAVERGERVAAHDTRRDQRQRECARDRRRKGGQPRGHGAHERRQHERRRGRATRWRSSGREVGHRESGSRAARDVFEAGPAVPVAVARRRGQRRGEHGRDVGRRGAVLRGAERGDDLVHAFRLRGQAHRVDAELAHVRQCVGEVEHAVRLRLDSVQHEKRLAFARGEREPVRVVEAEEPAIVLRQVVMPRGEAASGECERQPSVREYLGGEACRLLREDRRKRRARHLERRHPAVRPQRREECERLRVVDVEVRAGDERRMAGDRVHGAHVVRLKQEAPVGNEPAQRPQVRLRLHQHLRGEDDFLPGIGKPRGRVEPIGGPIFVPARADRLAQINAVDGRGGDRIVERVELGLRPVVENGSQRQLHGGPYRHGR